MLYSIRAPQFYAAGKTGLLAGDLDAWNLAWLSHGETFHPDPHFTSLVRRTLQFVIKTGGIDLIDQLPAIAKVRGLMRFAPAHVVKKLLEAQHLSDMPLYAAYGTTWTDTMIRRARLYREPRHVVLDKPIRDLTKALVVIDACK